MTERLSKNKELMALVLLCIGVMLYELLVMRIFSVLMWYHFASLAIGLALLGLGAGGLMVGLKPHLGEARHRAKFTLLFTAGVISLLVYLNAMHGWPELARITLAPFHQPFYKPFERPETTDLSLDLAVRLVVLSVSVGWPFVFAGAVTTGVLKERSPHIRAPYAATFLGSAAGCALFTVLLGFVSAPSALGVAAAFGALAALMWAPSINYRKAAFAALLLFVGLGAWSEISGSAEIPFARGRYEPNILAVKWNAMSRVAAYPLPPDDMLRPYGQSPRYKGEHPKQIGLVVDDSGYTNLFDGAESAANPEYYRSNLVSIPFHLRPKAKALLFGPGGGKDVWIALSFPEVTVRAVEINPLVVDMVENTFAGFTGKPYSDPRVKLTVADARRFAKQDRESYDVIGASAVFGRLPPAAGAFTLSEDMLHTADAFENYWDRLTDDGILSVTRFAYEQRALRLTALAREVLNRKGIAEPGRHIRVISDRGLANVMVSKKPFDLEDDKKLKEVLDFYGFEFLYPNPELGVTQLSRLVDEADFASALAQIPFDVSPPTDDKPFFYYTVHTIDFLKGSIPGKAGFDDKGADILRLSFIIIVVLSVCALVLPILYLRGLPKYGRGTVTTLLFFFCIGFGYMILEIGVMKRLLLLLGHPVYAVSFTLLTFLIGSGAGCLMSEKLAPSRKKLGLWLVAIAALGLLQAYLMPRILEHFMVSSTFVRFFLAFVTTLPLAFALGVPFPSAMAFLGESAGNLLPWVWSVNGFASVCASLGALLFAMNFGYVVTLDIGTSFYLLALACAGGLFARSATS